MVLESEAPVEYLGLTDVAHLLRTIYAVNKRDHLIALSLFCTGARISEVLNLKGEDIFIRDGKYVVFIRAQKHSHNTLKTLRIDTDPAFDMSPLIALAAQRGQSTLFGGADTSNFNKALKRYAGLAGIHTMFAHSHVFRKSAAHYIYDETLLPGAVKEFLGHKSMSSTMVYLQENDGKSAQDAMDNLKFENAQ